MVYELTMQGALRVGKRLVRVLPRVRHREHISAQHDLETAQIIWKTPVELV